MSHETGCIFCSILSGELESSMVYQDEVCSVFMDIEPVNPGHLLVVPNRHATLLADLKMDEGNHVFSIARQMASAVRNSDVRCEGVNFLLADGSAAGQEVFHVHLHVIPRFFEDGLVLRSRATDVNLLPVMNWIRLRGNCVIRSLNYRLSMRIFYRTAAEQS
jgi:histidine triad (HIT) family protein